MVLELVFLDPALATPSGVFRVEARPRRRLVPDRDDKEV
ncbi:hypothetical protein HMPREF1503_1642 [Olsenella uli MSTE5]|nr:hypothetical protein HMPREF1503_1642 [Olsenella uli MSTE5]